MTDFKARDEAINAAMKAWHGLSPRVRMREIVVAILDTVDPIIRTDEREKSEPTAEQVEEYATALRAKIEAEIRADERRKWLKWAVAHACCRAGLVASPDPCPWHGGEEEQP